MTNACILKDQKYYVRRDTSNIEQFNCRTRRTVSKLPRTPATPVLTDTSTAISLGIKPRQVVDRLPLNAHLRPCLHVHVCDFYIIVIARFHRKKKVMLTSALLNILLSKVSVISMMNGRLLFWSSRGIHHIPYFSI